MHKTSKLLCVFMCITLLFVSVFVPQMYAEATQGRINGSDVRVRDKATTSGTAVLTKLNMGTIVAINSKVTGQVAETGGGDVWYNITYGSITGYVYGKYISEVTGATPIGYDPDFEANLLNFPESYRADLRALHSVYPNWVFKADSVGISLDAAINLEYSADNMSSTRKLVETAYGLEWRDPRAGEAAAASRWIYASRQAIAFFMDPRNGLTVSPVKGSYPNIFTFMEQSYDSTTQTEAGLRAMIAGTFLANGYGGDGDAYVKDIMQAANESKVSPYIIAATILIEQGKGTSGLISGTYPGYEGYYNFFNHGASDDNPILNGLEYAKKVDEKAGKVAWDSRKTSIIEGAKLYESGYLGVDQDTYYYMDFNVKYPNRIWHQYATALYDQCTKAQKLISSCTANKNATITFKIPVYSSLPEGVYTAPTMADYSSQVTQPSGGGSGRRKGDYDGDGQVTVKELALIRMHLLGVKPLSATECLYLDVTGEGELTVKDLATVRMYLLGLVSI